MMSESGPSGLAEPDPWRIATRSDFGEALTLARKTRGLSVRQVAREAGVPASTLGGYFAGSHLPALQPPDLLSRLLRILGIGDEPGMAAWQEAYWRVRGPAAGDQPGGYRPDTSVTI